MLLANVPQKICIVVIFYSMLTACTIEPKRNPPITAQELDNIQTDTLIEEQDPELLLNEEEIALPLQEINQIGQVPTTETLTEQTLDVDLSDDTPIQLDFEQAALRNVITVIADALDLTMTIDPSIGNKITIRTAENKPLTKKDLWPLLQLLLNDANISMNKSEGIYHLTKNASKLPGTIGISPETLTSSSAAEVFQITPLRYITVTSAQTLLKPLIEPKGHLIALPMLNAIGLVTTPQHLKRLNKIINLVDADPFTHRGLRLFRLINSKATEVQSELDKILKALYGKASPTYRVVALERINAILVVSPPKSGFNEVKFWVEILDGRSEESGDQIFIYQVKNLDATKLAVTLSNVFKVDDTVSVRRETIDPKKPQKKPAKASVVKPISTIVSAELNVRIVADESSNSLLIRATPRDYRQLLKTISLLDQVPKEVMINVVIAEVTLTESTKFGIDWQSFFRGSKAGQTDTYLQTNFNVSNSTGLVLNHVEGNLNLILNMMDATGDVSILSRPSLLVRNNEEASINVGANEPFVTGETSSTTSEFVTTNVQYKDTGISVKVTPRINDDGIINLDIFQELSQLGETRADLQSFLTRKIETSVVVRDKSAIVIGGLIEKRQNNSKNGIPFLKDIPIFGNLFASTEMVETRTELVLIIVPEIVNPEADNSPLVRKFKQRMNLVSKLLNQNYILTDN